MTESKFIKVLAAICLFFISNASMPNALAAQGDTIDGVIQTEGPIVTAEILVGPFDLQRKYRSMEGPYAREPLRVSDLITSKQVEIPESLVRIPGTGTQAAPAMTSGKSSQKVTDKLPGLISSVKQKRELLWLKAVKIDLLDENDHLLPDAAFFCHATIDVDLDFRNEVFPLSEHSANMRHIVLTQGQTEFSFPNGFGLPVASDEKWNFIFQAINRTSDVPRRIKQRCTLTFVRDRELVYPMKALFWYYPVINVVIDRNSPERALAEHRSCLDCSAMSEGVPAPSSMKNMIFTDKFGRSQIGHWVVPPGIHTYCSPISEVTSLANAGFASTNPEIHLVLTHIHPFCEKCSLVECSGANRREIVTVTAKTDTKNLQLSKIDTVSSIKGIPLESGKNYELEATYNNTSGTPQDSMAGMALYCSDNKFVRPAWALAGDMNAAYCGTVDDTKSHRRDRKNSIVKINK